MALNVARINFALNVGEVSARFEARQDKLEKYSSACRQLDNWLPLTMGGVTRRPGWAYVATAKFSGLANARVVMIEFRFSSEQAYTLEFGDLYVRFYKDGAPVMDPLNPAVVHELVTPFALADLDLIKIGSWQSADVMYIATGIYPVYKLARIDASPDEFTIAAVAFNPPATQSDSPLGTEIGSGTLTLSALTGATQTATAANACFLAGDAGRTINSGAGRAIITTIGGPTVANIDIITDFNALVIAEDEWYFSGFGEVDMDPNARVSGSSVIVDSSVATFRTTDVGKYLQIYGGLIKLEAYVAQTQMNGTILNTLRDVPNAPTTGLPYNDPPATAVWNIEVEAWSDTLGYPNCGCFFQSRMWLCKGQTINGSVTGDFENFSKGSAGDDAIQRTIDDDQVNPIRWVKGLRSLQVGTGGSAYEVTASSAGKALTPSDFTVLPISSRGSANIPPIRIGGQLIHVQYGQKKIRELVFDFVTDKFKSPSLVTLAEHLTEENFLMDIAFQQEPDSIVWCVRNDGMLLALTYQEDENVIGWSKHPTAGNVKSVCTIPRPSTGKDWLWASIERDINGVTETYIEQMEADATITRQWANLQTDSALIVVPDANLACSGLDHLEGETVKVIGDGMMFNDAVVTGGSITLSPAISVGQAEIGLEYISEGLTCEPAIPPEQGGMFTCRRWKALGMRVRHAGPGLTLNVDDSEDVGLSVRKSEHQMDAAIPLQEGKLCTEQTNYNPFCRILFKQTLPFPAEVMNIVGDLEIGTDWCCDTVDEGPYIAVIHEPPPDVPPPQQVGVECCYDNHTGIWSDAVSSSGAISYVAADHTFWCTSGEASGFVSGPYPDGPGILWKLWKPTEPTGPSCALTDISSTEAVPFTGHTVANLQSTQGAQAGRSGHSDEKSYMLHIVNISPPLWDGNTNTVVYFGETSGAVPCMLSFGCSIIGPWTKYGNDIFSVVYCIGSGGLIIAHWPIPFVNNYQDYVENFVTGGVTDPGSPIPGITSMDAIKALHANSSALYVLVDGAEFANPKVYSLEKDTFALIDVWDITNPDFATTLSFHVFSNGLIYLLAYAGGNDWNIGTLDTTTGTVTTVDTFLDSCALDATSPAGTIGFHYADGFFWIGHDGGNVLKVGPIA